MIRMATAFRSAQSLSTGGSGRFGRKAAFVPTLRRFNDGAFQVEVGITNPSAREEGTVTGSPLPPGTDPAADPELSERSLELTDAFVRLLAPPAPRKQSSAARRGQSIFREVRCTGCHVPVLQTGDNPIAALRHKSRGIYRSAAARHGRQSRGHLFDSPHRASSARNAHGAEVRDPFRMTAEPRRRSRRSNPMAGRRRGRATSLECSRRPIGRRCWFSWVRSSASAVQPLEMRLLDEDIEDEDGRVGKGGCDHSRQRTVMRAKP